LQEILVGFKLSFEAEEDVVCFCEDVVGEVVVAGVGEAAFRAEGGLALEELDFFRLLHAVNIKMMVIDSNKITKPFVCDYFIINS
jgi:hypothetical protein